MMSAFEQLLKLFLCASAVKKKNLSLGLKPLIDLL